MHGPTWKFLSAVWVLALLVWGVFLGVEWYFSGPVSCALGSGSSVYGTAAWSWLPPGRTCTWDLQGVTHTDGPPVARLGMLLLFVLWGVSLLLLRPGKEEAPDDR